MSGALLWGYDATNKVWIPLQVDANGLVKVDLSNINLDDLADVSVAAPADDDLFYYDDATGLWKSRKLVNADIPAAIARDTEVVSAIGTHAAKTTGTHGAGSDYLVNTAMRKVDITPVAGSALRKLNFTAETPFSAAINGAPTSTSVVYDGELNEGSLKGISSGAAYWGRIILHNTTRGNSRKIVSVDTTTNTITTEDTSDDWANNDVITTQSQTNTRAGYVDIDLSNEVPSTAYAGWFFCTHGDVSGGADASRYAIFHPYTAYDAGYRCWFHSALANEQNSLFFGMEVVDQKITYIVNNVTDSNLVFDCKGIMKTPA